MIKVDLARDPDGKASVAAASYRLIFTVPPTGSKNFRLVPVEKCDESAWNAHCKAFEQSAESIFNRHNIGVTRDTTEIPTKKITPIEIFFHKTFGTLKN